LAAPGCGCLILGTCIPNTLASKYGTLSVDAGCVDVSWRLDGNVFAMSWTECDRKFCGR
jgi:hypothetical protein